VLSGGKVLPLRNNGSVGLKVEIGLASLCLALKKHLAKSVYNSRVQPRVLIFGTHRHKPKVNGFWLLDNTQKLDERRGCKPAAALFYRLADTGKAKPKGDNPLSLVADEEGELLIDDKYKLLHKLSPHLGRNRHGTVKL